MNLIQPTLVSDMDDASQELGTAVSTDVFWALCKCGCGTPTRISEITFRARGWVKGEPIPYARGHHADPERGLLPEGVLIDPEDADLVLSYTWHVRASDGYVVGSGYKVKRIALHNLIMDVCSGDTPVDHINRNKLDNRRSNLRVTTRSINRQNTEVRGSVSRRYEARYRYERWRARITVDGKRIHLGDFDSEELAESAVAEALAARAGDDDMHSCEEIAR
jgi:hypothetical protein